jgi:Leucine-rich repeat (LRR) protein
MTTSHLPTKINVPSFVSSLALTSNLEHIDISNNNVGDTGAADLIYVLTKLPGLHHLVELNLGGNSDQKEELYGTT